MGRHAKYTDNKLVDSIQDYFVSKNLQKMAPSKAGLCVFLGISRDTYSEYRKKYPDTIRVADGLIEEWWVNRLAGQSATGAIFYLKNAFKEDYKDKNETDITSGGLSITFDNAFTRSPKKDS